MTIEADTSAAKVMHYSIFDRTPADIDNPDLAGDLDHLAASLDYLDCLASAQQAAPKPNGRHTPYSACPLGQVPRAVLCGGTRRTRASVPFTIVS